MKVSLFTYSFLIFSVFSSLASDTLIRSSVWNFNVGDTFDFRTTVQSNAPIQGTYYKRIVVTNIRYSVNNDSLIIETIEKRNHSPLINSEITIDRLDSQEIFIINKSAHYCNSINIMLIDSSMYLGRKENRVTHSCFEAGWDARYVEGLGQVYDYSVIGDPFLTYTTKELIYYSKGNEKWGSRINDNLLLSNSNSIDKNLNLEFKTSLDAENRMLSIYLNKEASMYNLKIIDATGRVVNTLTLKDSTTSISVRDLQSGIYFIQLSTPTDALIKRVLIK